MHVMSTTDGVTRLRTALLNSDPAAVIGQQECAWLDVKSGLYPLDRESGKDELAKDVAAFANTATGGLLLIGYKTSAVDGEELVAELRPLPKDQVDLDRYRKVIRQRVVPAPHGCDVNWIETTPGRGVLLVDIPPQPATWRPFVVVPPPDGTKSTARSVAVPVRAADGTHWLPHSEIQRLLALGWSSSGGPSPNVLAAIVDKAASVMRDSMRPAQPEFEVGAGTPGWKQRFRDAYDSARQQVPLGKPTTEVHVSGPGVVQRVAPGDTPYDWVLCALPNRLPVVVAEPIWEALHAAGSAVPDGDVLGALGYPVLESDQAHRLRIIDIKANFVLLRGGRWGDGRLVREDDRSDWSWQPDPSFTTNVTRAARNWTAHPKPPQLRARAIATLPWARTATFQVAMERQRELADTLPVSNLAGALTILSQRRGADLRAADWRPGPNRNGLNAVSYSTTISAPDGTPALTGEVMIAIPATELAIVTCAELRIEDAANWAKALHDAGKRADQPKLQVTLEELFEFFIAASQTATEVLPALITPDPRTAPWAWPPQVELRLTAERQLDAQHPSPSLTDLVDFTAFGDRTVDDRLNEMTVTIAAPPQMTIEARRDLVRCGMAHMGQAFGYALATPDAF